MPKSSKELDRNTAGGSWSRHSLLNVIETPLSQDLTGVFAEPVKPPLAIIFSHNSLRDI